MRCVSRFFANRLLAICLLAALATGCAVQPPLVYRSSTHQTPAAQLPEYAERDDYVPPLEYVEGAAPVYYDSEPGIAYYPLLLSVPGSCYCIVPMRYARGIWFGPGGVVLHRGYFPYRRPAYEQRAQWFHSGGAIHGHRPVSGTVTFINGRGHAMPPAHHAHEYRYRHSPGPPPTTATPTHPVTWQRRPEPVQPRPAPAQPHRETVQPRPLPEPLPRPLRAEPRAESVPRPASPPTPGPLRPATAPPSADALPRNASPRRPPERATPGVGHER